MAEAQSGASSRIFISYRREDSEGHVLSLHERLCEHFGEDRVFKDTDSILPGQDFVEIITRELESCSVLLAVIGREWLSIRDPKSKTAERRLDNPHDYLRLELATALKNRHVRVIPVLVGRASMPSPEDLPPDLVPLSRRNAVELSATRWKADVERLIRALEQATGDAAGGAQPPVRTSDRAHKPAESAAELSRVAPPTNQRGEEFDELEARRKRQVAEHVKAAREAFEAGDYEAVLAACKNAVWLDPQQPEARDLAGRARRALDGQTIQSWLETARQALGREDLAAASEQIDQALALNPTHEEALNLRQEVLRIRKQRERHRQLERQVRAALDRARASLDEDDFEAAIQHADTALAQDPNRAEAIELRSLALAKRDEERRQRELRRRAQQAIKEQRTGLAGGVPARDRELQPPEQKRWPAEQESGEPQMRREAEQESRLDAERAKRDADQNRPEWLAAETWTRSAETKAAVQPSPAVVIPSRVVPIVAGAAVVLLLVGGLWWWFTNRAPEIQLAEQRLVRPARIADAVDAAAAARANRLDELRTLARSQQQAGQPGQALDTAAEGLQIDAADSVLLGVMDTLVRDAQSASERAKQEASNAGAAAMLAAEFSQALQRETEAVKLRDAKRSGAAARSFLAAADEFVRVAERSKQMATDRARQAADEQARQKQLAEDQARAKQAAAEQARQKQLAEEQARAKQAAAEQDFVAQRSTSQSSLQQAKAEIKDAKGQLVGRATLIETAKGVQIRLTLLGIPQGTHAFHIHETGRCDPPGFTTAGDHFNPERKQHGKENPMGRHPGDLANVTIPASGRLIAENVEPMVTLKTGAPNSLNDLDGASLVIHQLPDDNKTDPAGNAGAAIACGVITR